MSRSSTISHVSVSDPSSLSFVDDLLQACAFEDTPSPLVAFPASDKGTIEFQTYTARELTRSVDAVVGHFIGQGLEPAVEDVPPVVGLIGLTNFPFFVTMHALSRLGYTVFLLSSRLSVDAYDSLLDKTGCKVMVYSEAQESVISEVTSRRTMNTFAILSQAQIDKITAEDPSTPTFELHAASASKRIAFILHSSGSTGLPKPIHQTHSAILSGMGVGYGGRALNTCPLFHLHGLGMMHRTMFKRGTTFYPDFATPLTSSALLSLLEIIKPSAFFAVPYNLKLAAETGDSLDILSACEVVTSAGSACPDQLGDLLTQKGVHLVSICGTSETGPVMMSNRERGDPTWNYLRIIPSAKPYVWMKPVAEDTFELVALHGMKTLVISNSDDPPKSYHSRDLWSPHASIPNAWKYIGRLDDRVTLSIGEKVLPLPIEGRIRQDHLVKEAVVFGVGRDVPGLLLFRAESARNLSDDEFVQKTWPSVEDANSRAEGFSHIGRDMVVPLSADQKWSQTDKSTVIRAKVYQEFAEIIDKAYLESAHNEAFDKSSSSRALPDQLDHILFGQSGMLGSNESVDPGTDLFNAGLDSLKAIQFARTIRKQIIPPSRRDGIKIDQNVIYAHGNIRELAAYLESSLRGNCVETNAVMQNQDQVMAEKMQRIIVEHSTQFASISCGRTPPSASTSTSASESSPASYQKATFSVLLTGSTGSLGSHILVSLLSMPHIDRIYCLLRPSSPGDSYKHVVPAAHGNKSLVQSVYSRVHFLRADITSGIDLGLDKQALEIVRNNVKAIIHCGWAVNFNIQLGSFAPLLQGTVNLLKFCESIESNGPAGRQHVNFVFISSISVAQGKGSQAGADIADVSGCDSLTMNDTRLVPEGPIADLNLAQNTGYGQSKLCAEHIIASAVAAGSKINAQIIRVGQVVGDKYGCVWNPNESIPLLLRTATTIGALPTLDETCSWLPVNVAADAIVDLVTDATNVSGSETSDSNTSIRYYNIVNNRTPFSWTKDLLPTLRETAMEFKSVAPVEWLDRLRAGGAKKETVDDPSMKLFDFWEGRYNRSSNSKELKKRLQVRFDSKRAEALSRTMEDGIPDLLRDGYIQIFLKSWKDVWERSVT